jgi:hypothetical protein
MTDVLQGSLLDQRAATYFTTHRFEGLMGSCGAQFLSRELQFLNEYSKSRLTYHPHDANGDLQGYSTDALGKRYVDYIQKVLERSGLSLREC